MGQEVVALTHNASYAPNLAGVRVEYVDILNINRLAEVFSEGDTLFMLNPPGDVSKNSVTQELETVEAIIDALNRSSMRKIVAQSTQGAQPGTGIGDFGPLFTMENGLKKSGRSVRVTRASYYMSNWLLQADEVRKTGILKSFFPEDFSLAMVAPRDLGVFNAKILLEEFIDFNIQDFTGPQNYQIGEVALEFARVFAREVQVKVIPRDQWINAYLKLGFSEISAESYAKMTGMTLDRTVDVSPNPFRGQTTLKQFFDQALTENL
jgi:uncharacterized protein YbjT (DUF2867 family)